MITVVGIGPGNIKYLTEEAKTVIKNSRNTIAFGRVSESVKGLNSDIRTVKSVSEVKQEVERLGIESELTILVSGDPCYFGITDYLIRNGIEIDRVVTGVSSLQYMMSKIKRNYNDIKSVSFHGREPDFSIFEKGKSYFILTDRKNNPDYISRNFKEKGFSGNIILGENLSYDNEVICVKEIGEEFGETEISVVVVDLDVD